TAPFCRVGTTTRVAGRCGGGLTCTCDRSGGGVTCTPDRAGGGVTWTWAAAGRPAARHSSRVADRWEGRSGRTVMEYSGREDGHQHIRRRQPATATRHPPPGGSFGYPVP